MKYRRQEVICLVMLFVLLLLSGCTLKYTPRSPEEFQEETLRLERRAQTHKDPAARAEAQLELACLYLHHRNPQLNYGRALQEFETYLKVTTAEGQADEIQNWLHALRELERQERETAYLQERLASLAREEAHLKERFAGLAQENEEGRNSLASELRKNQELQTALDRLQVQVESLERTSRSLKDANDRMKETVEKLKNLDFKMEEKRRAIQ
jgi:chromosome segregation ATPase